MAALSLTCLSLLLLTSLSSMTSACVPKMASDCGKPHIVYILADDLGWSDVSWNAEDMRTPNLNKLRQQGVSLKYHYMQPACSASRVAFLTGYYPYKLGLQRNEMAQFHRWRNHSLSTDIRILPEYLRGQGYANHLVGKWQMGFCNWKYTPTRRGFDSFYGSYGGNSDHFTHTPRVGGYDFRNDLNVELSANGSYSTTLYTERGLDIIRQHNCSGDTRPLFLYMAYEAPHVPVAAPNKYIRKYCSHFTEDSDRKVRCGMMAALDEGVGKIWKELEDLGYTDNLLFVFTSDNGAPGQGGGSNWPLRGKKRSAYEGGVRVPTILYSKTLLANQPYEYEGLMHVTDWLPTILQVAKVDVDRTLPSDIDGFDQWSRIRRNEASRRSHMVYDLDIEERYSAIRINNWKLVEDNTGPDCWGWYNLPENVKKPKPSCRPFQLYDIDQDPNELNDLSNRNKYKKVLRQLKDFLRETKVHAESRRQPYVVNVTESFTENWNGIWSPGWCENAH